MTDIYEKAGLTSKEIEQIPEHIEDYLEDGSMFIFTDTYEKLFNYFLDTNEMPYGVAKGRTGDPDAWILEYLCSLSAQEKILL
jgi:hypothetical protein